MKPTPFLQTGSRVTCSSSPGTVTDTAGIRCYIDLDRGGGGWYRRDDPRLAHGERLTPPLTLPTLFPPSPAR